MPSAFLYHPYGMYTLMELDGISLAAIQKLEKANFTLYDFQIGSEKVNVLSKSKSSLVKKIKESLHLLNEKKFNETLFKLASKDISGRNINTLKGLGFNYLDIPKLTAQKLSSLTGVSKNAMFKKIQVAYDLVEKDLVNVSALYTYELEAIFDRLSPNESLTLKDLKKKISSHFNIQIHDVDENNIKKFLQKKIEQHLIYNEGMMFTKKYIKVEEYLDGLNRDIYKDILMARMNNMTLQEIGDSYNLTRERIRQLEKRAIQNIPKINEILYYAPIFTEYEWEENLFIDVFGESQNVYRFINIVLKKGKKSLIENLDELNLENYQKKKIAKYYNFFINYENKAVSYSKMNFFEHLMFKYGQENIKDSEFVERANNFIYESDLEDPNLLFDYNSVRGLGERSSKVLRGRTNSYRFFDLDSLDKNTIKRLKEIMELPTGIYSMRKIFEENKEFITEIGIHTAYELHNLYKKKIVLEDVEYTRMPEFSVGKISKDQFLKDLFYEQAPIELDGFTQYVEENYGLKQTSLRSLLLSDYIQYLDDNQIRVDYLPLTINDIEKLRSLLTEEIYMIEEISLLGRSMDKKFHDKFINNHALVQIDYHIKGQFVLKRKYQSLDSYFIDFILKKDYFYNPKSGIYRSKSFIKTLYDLEKSLDIVKIEKDMYITIQKLNSACVSKDDLIDFRNQALLLAPEQEYFTIYTLRKYGLLHELDNLGFDDVFYERIIWTDNRIRTISLANGSIFLKADSDVNLISFIQSIVEKKESINVYDLQEFILDRFNLKMDMRKIINLFKYTNMYYSEDLNKFYMNKETFYEEIYK